MFCVGGAVEQSGFIPHVSPVCTCVSNLVSFGVSEDGQNGVGGCVLLGYEGSLILKGHEMKTVGISAVLYRIINHRYNILKPIALTFQSLTF